MNFPICAADADFLSTFNIHSVKELCIRLIAKKLQLGAVIDLRGQLFESQIVELMNRKYSVSDADSTMTMGIDCAKPSGTSSRLRLSSTNEPATASSS